MDIEGFPHPWELQGGWGSVWVRMQMASSLQLFTRAGNGIVSIPPDLSLSRSPPQPGPVFPGFIVRAAIHTVGFASLRQPCDFHVRNNSASRDKNTPLHLGDKQGVWTYGLCCVNEYIWGCAMLRIGGGGVNFISYVQKEKKNRWAKSQLLSLFSEVCRFCVMQSSLGVKLVRRPSMRANKRLSVKTKVQLNWGRGF